MVLLLPQVFVSSSGKQSELGHPFGYLKASTTLTCVNLFVMPYNYPVLLPLLGQSQQSTWFSIFFCYTFIVLLFLHINIIINTFSFFSLLYMYFLRILLDKWTYQTTKFMCRLCVYSDIFVYNSLGDLDLYDHKIFSSNKFIKNKCNVQPELH